MKIPKVDPKNVVLTLSLASLLGITGFFAYREITTIQRAWPEMMFAKEHPTLVASTREMYNDGMTTVEKWVIEKNVKITSPVSTEEVQSK